MQNVKSRVGVLPLAVTALACSAFFAGVQPTATQAQPASAVKLSDFAGSWIIMTAFDSSGNSAVMRLRVVNGRITGGAPGSSGKLELSRLHGRVLRGHVTVGKQNIPMSAELSSDKGQLILITAPPASEYDVAVAWRQGYKPRM
jgi:hypothetical protein